ncbi:MAG: tetratricopeptide repeat protein, partial [Candidatus Competibacter sp.]
ERWEYCATILRDLGLEADQKDAGLKDLMDALDGHPLAMRALLPRLREVGAGVLADQLKGRIRLESKRDPLQARLFAVLEFVEEALPEEFKQLLFPLGLYERFVDAETLGTMVQQSDFNFSQEKVEQLLEMLALHGLLHPQGDILYKMHLALTSFLRVRPVVEQDNGQQETWRRAFVNVMGSLADYLACKDLQEKSWFFHWHGANFDNALIEAEALGMNRDSISLALLIAVYAQDRRDFSNARKQLINLIKHLRKNNDLSIEAIAYQCLGMIAAERRDFDDAGKWYQKSLAIWKKQGNKIRIAAIYNQLGTIAEEQLNFTQAEKLYRRSLVIFKKYHDKEKIAIVYSQLGLIEQKLFNLMAAEKWFIKSLEIGEECSRTEGISKIYHQLGMLAGYRFDFKTSENYYIKSLEIKERQGDEYGAAITYHQLGSLRFFQGDFSEAEKWYKKSLEIKERQGDEYGAAATYGQLGIVAAKQGRYLESGQWLISCIRIFEYHDDSQNYYLNLGNFLTFYRETSPDNQAQLRQIWEEAGLGAFPEDGNPP